MRLGKSQKYCLTTQSQRYIYAFHQRNPIDGTNNSQSPWRPLQQNPLLPSFLEFLPGIHFTNIPHTSSWRRFLEISLLEPWQLGLRFSRTRSTTLACGHTSAGTLYLTLGGTTSLRFVEENQPHHVCHSPLSNHLNPLTVRYSPNPSSASSFDTATTLYSASEKADLQTTNWHPSQECGRFPSLWRGHLSGCR